MEAYSKGGRCIIEKVRYFGWRIITQPMCQSSLSQISSGWQDRSRREIGECKESELITIGVGRGWGEMRA
jgi:hypothetical protein